MKKLNIMLTNDDGIHSNGLKTMKEALLPLGDVYTFAPAEERSARSSALTIHGNIYVKDLANHDYRVDGYPVDCVNIGLHGIEPKVDFDLVISGINHGVNMGDDVHYSGTVGAAKHAFIHGCPAIAVSCDIWETTGDFHLVADFIAGFVHDYEEVIFEPSLLNINYPVFEGPVRGMKWTKLGKRIYRDNYKKQEGPDGGQYFNLGGSILSHKEEESTDFAAFHKGYVSVTPLKLDATNYQQLERQL